jgi:hypothetical protein
MNKLLILSASFLFIAVSVSTAGAHGPNGSGSGYRSHAYSKPHFSRPSHLRSGIGHHQRRGHSHFGSFPRSRRHHLPHGSVSSQAHRLPKVEHGVLHSKPGPLQKKPFFSPITKFYDQGFGVSPLRKALERKGSRQVPRHTHSPHSHPDNHSDPWFLYGKGKEFRQMGILPPIPQTVPEN